MADPKLILTTSGHIERPPERFSCYSLDTGKAEYSVDAKPSQFKKLKGKSFDSQPEIPHLNITDTDYPSSDPPYRDLLSRLQSSVRREEAMLKNINQSGTLEPALAEELVQELSEQLEQSERESRCARENLEETKRFYSSQIHMYEKQIADIHKGTGKGLGSRIADLERENSLLKLKIRDRENLHYQVIGGLKSGLEKEVEESKAITSHYRKKQNETNQQFNNLKEQITYLDQIKDTLEIKVQTQQDRIDKLEFEKTRQDTLVKELQGELTQRRSEYMKVQEEANQKYTKLSSWQTKQFDQMKTERMELMKNLERERLKNADLSEKVRSMEQNLVGEVKLKEAERKSVLSLQSQIEDLERIQSSLEKRIVDSDLQHQMYSKQFKHKMKIMEAKLADLTDANQKMQIENHDLGSKLNSVRQAKSKLYQELMRTQQQSVAEVKRLESCVPNMLSKIKRENEALGQRINDQIVTLRTEKSTLQDQLRDSEKAMREAVANLDKLKFENISSGEQVVTLKKDLAISKTESDFAHALLGKEIQRRRRMGLAIERQSEGLVSVQRDHSRLVQRTKQQLSEFALLFESIMVEVKQATERTVLSYESRLAKINSEVCDLKDFKVRAEELEAENSTLRAQHSDLMNVLSERNSAIALLEKSQRELMETIEKNDQAQSELKRSSDFQLKKVEAKKKEVEFNVTDLQNSIKSKDREILNLSQSVELLNDKLQDLVKEKSNTLSAMAAELKMHTSSADEWKTKFGNAQSLIERNQEQIDAFATERLQMAATIEALSIEIAEIQNQKNESMHMCERMGEKMRLGKDHLNHLQSEKKVMGATIETLSFEAQKSSREVKQLREQFAESEASLAVESARVRELREYSDGLRKENTKHRGEADSLRRRIRELHGLAKDQLSERLLEISQSKEALKIAHSEEINALRKKLDDMNGEVQRLRVENVEPKKNDSIELIQQVYHNLYKAELQKKEHIEGSRLLINHIAELAEENKRLESSQQNFMQACEELVNKAALDALYQLKQSNKELIDGSIGLVNEIADLSDENTQLKSDNEQLMQGSASLVKETVDLTEENEELKSKNANLIDGNVGLVNRIADLADQIRELKARNCDLIEGEVNLVHNIVDIADEKANCSRANEELKLDNQRLESENSGLIGEKTQLGNQIADLQEEVMQLKIRKAELVDDEIRLVNYIADLTASNGSLEINENLRLKKRMDEILRGNRELASQVGYLVEEIQRLKIRNSEFIDDGVNLVNEIADLAEDKLECSRRGQLQFFENVRFQKLNDEFADDNLQLVNQISQLAQEIRQLKFRNYELMKEEEERAEIHLRSLAATDGLELENARLKDKISNGNMDLANTVNDLRKEMRRLKIQNSEFFDDNLVLKRKNEEIVDQNVRLVHKVSDLSSEIRSLEIRLEDKEMMVQKLENSNSDFMYGSARLVNEVDDLYMENKQLEMSNGDILDRNENLMNAVAALYSKISSLEAEKLQVGDSESCLVKTVEKLTAEVKLLKSSKSGLVNDGVSLVNTISDMADEIDCLKKTKKELVDGGIELVNALADLSDEKKNLVNGSGDLVNAISDLVNQVQNLKTQKQSVMESRSALVDELSALDEKLRTQLDWKQRHNSLKKELDNLREELLRGESKIKVQTDLQGENEGLRNELKEKCEELKILSEKVEGQLHTHETLRNELDECRKEILVLEEKLRAQLIWKEKSEAFKKDLDAKYTELSTLDSKFRAQNDEDKILKKNLEERCEEMVRIKKERDSLRAEVSSLRQAHERYCDTLSSDLSQHASTILQLERSKADLSQEVQNLQKDLCERKQYYEESRTQLTSDIQSITRERDSQIEVLRSLEADRDRLRNENAGLQSKCENLSGMTKDLSSDLLKSSATVENLENKVKALGMELETCASKNRKLTGERNDLNEALACLESERTRLSSECCALAQRNEALSQALDENQKSTLEERYNQLRRTNSDLSFDLNRVKNSLKDKESELSQLEMTVQALEIECNAKENKAAEYKEEIRILLSNTKEDADKLENLRSQLSRAERHTSEIRLEQEHERMQDEMLTAAIQSKQLQIDRLKEELDEEKQMKKLVKRQLQDLQSKIGKMQCNFDTLDYARETSDRCAETLRRQLEDSEQKLQTVQEDHENSRLRSEFLCKMLLAARRVDSNTMSEFKETITSLEKHKENAEARLAEVMDSRDQLAKAKADLTNVIYDLEVAEKMSRDEVREYQMKNSQLVAETKKLESKYDEYEERITYLKQQNMSYLQEIQGKVHVKSEMEHIQKLNADLKEKLVDLESREKARIQTASALPEIDANAPGDNYAELIGENEDLQAKLLDCEKEIEDLQSHIETMEHESLESANRVKKTKFSASILETEIECHRLEISRLDGVIEESRKANDSLQAEVEALKEENESLRGELNEIQTKSVAASSYNEIDRQLAISETELKSSHARCKQLEKQVEDSLVEKERVLKTLDEVQKEMHGKDKIAKNVEEGMYAEYRKMKEELNDSMEKLLDVEELSRTQADKIKQMTDIIAQQTVDIADYQNQVSAFGDAKLLTAENDRLNSLVTSREDQSEALQELAEANQELEERVRELQKENVELTEKMNKVKNNPEYYQYSQLKLERDNAREKLQRIQDSNNKLSPKVFEKQRALDHQKRVVRTLRGQLKDVSDAYKEKEKNLHKLQESHLQQTKEFQSAMHELNELQSEYESLQDQSRSKISSLERSIRDLKQEKRELSSSIRSESSPLNDRKSPRHSPSKQVKELHSQIAQLKRSEAQLKRQLLGRSPKSPSKPKAKEAKVSKFKEKLQSQILDLEKEKEALERAQENQAKRIKEMEVLLKELGSKDVSKRLIELKNTIAELKRDRVHLQRETRDQKKRVAELEKFIKRNDSNGPVSGRELLLRKEKEALLQRLDALTNEKVKWETIERENEELVAEKMKITAELRNLKKQNKELEVKIEEKSKEKKVRSPRSPRSRVPSRVTRQSKQTKEEKETWRTEKEKLLKQINSLKSRLSKQKKQGDFEGEKANLVNEISSLRTELGAEVQKNSDLENRLKSLEKGLLSDAKLSEEITVLKKAKKVWHVEKEELIKKIEKLQKTGDGLGETEKQELLDNIESLKGDLAAELRNHVALESRILTLEKSNEDYKASNNQ